MSFVKQIVQERSFGIYFINANCIIKFYAYILVPHKMKEAFENAVNSGKYDLQKYGSIIKLFLGESYPSMEEQIEIDDFLKTFKGVN